MTGQIQNQDLPLVDASLTAFLCFLFGANAVAIKISLSGLGVFTTAGLRFSISVIAILLWAMARKKSFVIRRDQIQPLSILSISFAVQFALFYIGVSLTKATHATLLINLMPFFILCLAHFFIPGDRISKRKITGMLFGFSGILLILLGKGGISVGMNPGDLILLAGAFLAACRIIYLKRIIHTFESFHLVFYQMLLTVPLLFLAAWIFDDVMIDHFDLKVTGALMYQGLITASFGFLMWNNLLHKYGATTLHSFNFIMPLSGVFLATAVLNEPLTSNILMAMLLIASGIFVVNFKAKWNLPFLPPGRNL